VAARGVLAILFGLFALARPGMALPTLVLGFGVAVLLSGILAIVAGVRAEENQERSWPLTTEGIIAVAVGLLALLRPDAAARFWLYVVSGFVFVSGILHIFAAIRLRRDIRDELVLVVNGALTAAFAPWVFFATAKPSGRSTNTSSVAIASGVTAIMASVRVSKRRCMKYIATRAALPSASAHRSTPIVNFVSGV